MVSNGAVTFTIAYYCLLSTECSTQRGRSLLPRFLLCVLFVFCILFACGGFDMYGGIVVMTCGGSSCDVMIANATAYGP